MGGGRVRVRPLHGALPQPRREPVLLLRGQGRGKRREGPPPAPPPPRPAGRAFQLDAPAAWRGRVRPQPGKQDGRGEGGRQGCRGPPGQSPGVLHEPPREHDARPRARQRRGRPGTPGGRPRQDGIRANLPAALQARQPRPGPQSDAGCARGGTDAKGKRPDISLPTLHQGVAARGVSAVFRRHLFLASQHGLGASPVLAPA
mmetsp:Transcript_18542/g.44311  ORF Transcript_18542/g.44311 Transcript_18542/m.44311 type:complete len:202 (-) Transcript_18542:624-1229(-)